MDSSAALLLCEGCVVWACSDRRRFHLNEGLSISGLVEYGSYCSGNLLYWMRNTLRRRRIVLSETLTTKAEQDETIYQCDLEQT